MIDSYSSFIEFIAAVYFSLYLEDVVKHKIWTPDYKLQLKTIVRKFDFIQESTQKALCAVSSRRGRDMQRQVSHKGLFMLINCMLLLLFIGSCTDINEHFSLLLVVILAFATTLMGNKLLNKWKYVFYASAINVVVYKILLVCCERNCFFIRYVPLAKDYLVPVLILSLLLPIMLQVFVCWLYSSSYRGFLRAKFQKEQKDYNQVLAAIKNKNKELLPTEYSEIIVKNFFENDEVNNDTCISDYVQLVNARLVTAIQAPWYKILLSYLHFQLHSIFKMKNNRRTLELPTKEVHPERTYAVKMLPQKYRVEVDYQRELDHYRKLKREGKAEDLKRYCESRNINYSSMSDWLYRTKTKKEANKILFN